jgi:hypothetical protein
MDGIGLIDADPLPIITAAWGAAVGTPLASRMSPTSARERRCGDSFPACPEIGPMPGGTRRRCWTRPPRRSSHPASTCRCGTSRPGPASVYRHFPARADLIVAVYRHQVEACAQAAAHLGDNVVLLDGDDAHGGGLPGSVRTRQAPRAPS